MIIFKKSYLKKIWIAIIIIAGLSFIFGQFALYLFYAAGEKYEKCKRDEKYTMYSKLLVPMDPQTPIEKLSGIGKYHAYKLKRLEIKTAEDLITHFPFRYEDFSQNAQAANLTDGQKVTLKGNIWTIRNIRAKSGKFVTLATLADSSGVVDIVWFNQPYITKTLKPGTYVSVSGKVTVEYNKTKLLPPTSEISR